MRVGFCKSLACSVPEEVLFALGKDTVYGGNPLTGARVDVATLYEGRAARQKIPTSTFTFGFPIYDQLLPQHLRLPNPLKQPRNNGITRKYRA